MGCNVSKPQVEEASRSNSVVQPDVTAASALEEHASKKPFRAQAQGAPVAGGDDPGHQEQDRSTTDIFPSLIAPHSIYFNLFLVDSSRDVDPLGWLDSFVPLNRVGFT